MPELTQSEATRSAPELSFLDPLVGWIRAKGLQAPAAFVLEMHRPLMPMAFPAAVMAGTLVAPFFGPGYYKKIEALRDPAALDCVLERLSGRQVSGEGGVQEKGVAR